MKKTKTAFREAKPLTPRAAAQKREREVLEKMRELLESTSEAEFQEAMFRLFGSLPGESRYDDALEIWKSSHY